jgi:Patatin-like phospholipase
VPLKDGIPTFVATWKNADWKRLVADFFAARVAVAVLMTMLAIGLFFTDNPMFEGLLHLQSWTEIGLTVFTAFLVAFSCLVPINLIRKYGAERFNGRTIEDTNPTASPSMAWLLLALLPVAAVVWRVCERTELCDSDKTIGVLVGFISANTLILIAQSLQFLFTTHQHTGARKEPAYLVFPFNRLPVLSALLEWAYRTKPPLETHRRHLEGLAARKLTLLGPGYRYRQADGQVSFHSGHILAFVLAVLSFTAWMGLGAGHASRIGAMEPGRSTPALAYIMVLLMVVSWVLSGITFFLDRYRVPVLLLVGAWVFVTGQFPQSDFIFRVSPGDATSRTLPTPGATWSNYQHPIIVAAAGGGSQAAAWTTKVISELAAQLPNSAGDRNGFADNLALISGVSGGSVGALYVGAALSGKLDDDFRKQPLDSFDYDSVCDRTMPGRPHTPLALASLLARQSSIDDVAWALVNPDVWHVLQPFFRDQIMDRGWALERSIEERTHLQETYLSDWAVRAGDPEHPFPAFIFNATSAESGWPVALSSSEFPSSRNLRARTRKVQSIAKLFDGNVKLRVSTAARLSSTFPYVSPAARPERWGKEPHHLVDGGIYDNFGLLAAMDWLDDARMGARKEQAVALVEIRPSPGRTEPPLVDAYEYLRLKNHGWSFQIVAPLTAVLKVRDDEQLKADHVERDLYIEHLAGLNPKMTLTPFEFAYPVMGDDCDAIVPESWKMTPREQRCVDEAWQEIQRSGKVEVLRQFLHGSTSDAAGGRR